MAHADFIHLRVHTPYSLSEGACRIPDLIARCADQVMPAVAVTDTGNMFAALEFALAASSAGVQPIIGCQLAIAQEDRDEGRVRNGGAVHAAYDQIVLLVQDETGYENLLKLASMAFLENEGGENFVTLEAIEAHSGGLIALSGGAAGPIGRLLAEGQVQPARGMTERLAAMFPGRFYIEISRHGTEVETAIEGDLIDIAYAQDLPLVATNEAFFMDAEIYEAHDALLCIAQGCHISQTERRRLTPEFRLKSPAEMRELFDDLPEAVDNTVVIARRCAYMPTVRNPILPAFAEDGTSEEDALRQMAADGLEDRLRVHVFADDMSADEKEAAAKPYRERLEFELGVIVSMGFPGYFLIVADFIQWAKGEGIPVGPGRGSGAGSVVAWALTITDLDPLRFGLLFERFLNPDRVSMPDFDIDFCQDRRDEVISYVQDKYGADKVAQIITFGKLQARAAIRDVGRVLGMPYGQVDRISKLVPFNPAKPPTLKQALEMEPELDELRRKDETVGRLIDIAMKLEGLYRHASTHAAGVVIGDRPLEQLLPLYRDPRSPMVATQFSMKYTELAGLVKFDFLGLKTLTVLETAVALLADRGFEIELDKIPLDDRRTFEMLGKGDSTGVFQLESSGMRDVLRQMKPDTFEDIIALVALYRPGPMDNIPSYIARKKGEEEPDYLHPDLEDILKETFGVMIYQEQVMQIAQKLSGFSLAAADLLRRAMGKKIKAEMDAQREAFLEGAVDRGVDRGKAGHIFEQVDKFAGYGFNKSHAAAYALVAYQTAWLKANHPVEFFAASMTLDLGNTDKLNLFRQELDRLEIPLLPPDMQKSGVTFGVEILKNGTERGAIRYALAAVKNVGRQAMADAIAERDANGPFEDVFDFVRRVGARVANKRQMENLIRAGAFDSMEPNRRKLFEGVDTLIREASLSEEAKQTGQGLLFGGGDATQPEVAPLPKVPDWPSMDRLREEFDAVGSYLSAHPLDAYTEQLQRMGVKPIATVTATRGEKMVKLAGVVLGKQERTSARGNRFAFVQLTDSSGVFEVVVFSELLAAYRDQMEANSRLLIHAEARAEGDGEGEGLRLTAMKIESLDEALSKALEEMKVFVDDERALPALKSRILVDVPVANTSDGAPPPRVPQPTRGRTGKGRISLVLSLDGLRTVEVALPGRHTLSPELVSEIGAVEGVRKVEAA